MDQIDKGTENMEKKWWEIIHLRPQVLSAIAILGTIAIIAMYQDMVEIAGVAGAGIIALAKDVITSDN
tara:strand:+ start:79 stop:282 length:204 start_codon:yes stop_codon:yes gene_type:complete